MYAARISCACAVRQVFVRRVGAAVLVRLRFSSAVRSLNLAIHALRLRSQKMLRSQSRERLLFNRCSLLLFSCPTMLDTGAVGPTLYVLFLDGYVYIYRSTLYFGYIGSRGNS